MLSIFQFSSYREYLLAWIEGQGSRGYGIKGRIAQALGVSPSLVSQILKGDKTLTSEQTSDLSDYLGLTEMESDYLQLLADLERAGTQRYREKLMRKIKSLQEQSRRIGLRVPRQKELTDEQKAIFYSSWIYTGIFNLVAVPTCNHVNAIADYLHLETGVVNRAVRFLLENGLCKESNGVLSYGPASIHVDRESPFVNTHHRNWRLQAVQRMEARKDSDIFFTSPMSLSKEAAREIQKLLPTVIQNVMQISGPSPSELTACLNIDWFEY